MTVWTVHVPVATATCVTCQLKEAARLKMQTLNHISAYIGNVFLIQLLGRRKVLDQSSLGGGSSNHVYFCYKIGHVNMGDSWD